MEPTPLHPFDAETYRAAMGGRAATEIRIPRLFLNERRAAGYPVPVVVRESTVGYFVRTDDPNLLPHVAAALCAWEANTAPRTRESHALAMSARATFRAIEVLA